MANTVHDNLGNGNYSSLVLKVTPDELRRQSDSVAADVSFIKEKFDNITRVVDSSDSFWRGDSSDSFRSVYNGCKEEIYEIIARLSEHITDLNQIAGIYDSGEKEIVDYISSLPADVII